MSKDELERVLTRQQRKLLQDTFRKLLPVSEVAAELFYRRLFELAPELRPMFKSDMKEQEQKLMDMLFMAINGFDRFDQLLLALANLGERHLQYGVLPEHYAVVEKALTWTLEQGLEDDFTPEVRAAWDTTYQLISGVMLQAAATIHP